MGKESKGLARTLSGEVLMLGGRGFGRQFENPSEGLEIKTLSCRNSGLSLQRGLICQENVREREYSGNSKM